MRAFADILALLIMLVLLSHEDTVGPGLVFMVGYVILGSRPWQGGK